MRESEYSKLTVWEPGNKQKHPKSGDCIQECHPGLPVSEFDRKLRSAVLWRRRHDVPHAVRQLYR
jgi:hypothetical protein